MQEGEQMSKTRFECRQVILKNWTQMTPGSETLTYAYIFEGSLVFVSLCSSLEVHTFQFLLEMYFWTVNCKGVH